MVLASSLFVTTLLAWHIINAAKQVVGQNSPVPVALPFRKHFTTTDTGRYSIVENDRRRVGALHARTLRASHWHSEINNATNFSLPAVDFQSCSYIVDVGVGDPPTNYSLQIDSGSSNTWIRADMDKPYVKTKTSVPTDDIVTMVYGSGNFSGNEFIDQVTLTPKLVIHNQSIGVANTSCNISFDGILGIGLTSMTVGTLSPDKNSSIPTVTDNLFAEGQITDNLVSVSFQPFTFDQGEQMNGEITFGGIDLTKFTGNITYTPVTNPACLCWSINATWSYGESVVLIDEGAGIVDTGTTLLMMASEAFAKYKAATGGVLEKDLPVGLMSITGDQVKQLQSLFITISGMKLELTANAQIWPRKLNSIVDSTGGSVNKTFLAVADIGNGFPVSFFLGQVFIERFYTVFDTGNQQVGFATTNFTNATIH